MLLPFRSEARDLLVSAIARRPHGLMEAGLLLGRWTVPVRGGPPGCRRCLGVGRRDKVLI